MSQSTSNAIALQNIPVYRAEAFCVAEGVNSGEALSFADELVAEDIYTLTRAAPMARLGLSMVPNAKHFHISENSELGEVGEDAHLDACLTFMAPDGTTREILVFVELFDGGVDSVYLHPLGPLQENTNYTLVGIDQKKTSRWGIAF